LNRDLSEKLIIAYIEQLKEFTKIYGGKKLLVTLCTIICHWALFWDKWMCDLFLWYNVKSLVSYKRPINFRYSIKHFCTSSFLFSCALSSQSSSWTGQP